MAFSLLVFITFFSVQGGFSSSETLPVCVCGFFFVSCFFILLLTLNSSWGSLSFLLLFLYSALFFLHSLLEVLTLTHKQKINFINPDYYFNPLSCCLQIIILGGGFLLFNICSNQNNLALTCCISLRVSASGEQELKCLTSKLTFLDLEN